MNWAATFAFLLGLLSGTLLMYDIRAAVRSWRRSKSPDLGEVIQVNVDESLPHVTDGMWQAIEDTFLMFDQKIYDEEVAHQYWVGDFRAEVQHLLNPPPELFVPKIAHFGPEVVREMEFCHAVGSTVVHHKDCARAPHQDRRRWIWAFSGRDLLDWVDDEPGDWRPCGICQPYERAVAAASGQLPALHAAASATTDAVRPGG